MPAIMKFSSGDIEMFVNNDMKSKSRIQKQCLYSSKLN